MSVKIHLLNLGVVRTNCYIVGDTDTGDALVIDPADDASTILTTIRDEGWTVREILATHTHFDHVLAVSELKAETGAPFRIHRLDLAQLEALPQIAERLIEKIV